MARAPSIASPREGVRRGGWDVRGLALWATATEAVLLRSHCLCLDRDAAPGDLQFLTDDNIAEIGAQLGRMLSRLSRTKCACRQGAR